jgi:hypothetical protein
LGKPILKIRHNPLKSLPCRQRATSVRFRAAWCTGPGCYRDPLSAAVSQGYYGVGGYDAYTIKRWIGLSERDAKFESS